MMMTFETFDGLSPEPMLYNFYSRNLRMFEKANAFVPAWPF